MALMVGCGSRPVDPEDRKPPQDPNDPYEDWPMGGVPDTMPAPLDAGPVQGDGEPEPPEHTGGAADVMPAPLDGGSGGDTKADS